jgi:3-oxoacyl-[acyl-carrier-protein] synthase III
MLRNAIIASTARYVPETEITNATLKQGLKPETIDKLEKASGILTRFYAPPSWAASDVALPSAKLALERAGIGPEDVDLVIVGTDTPDYITPSTSVVLQHKLGAKRSGTFDVGCACASFPTALSIGAGLIATNAWIKNVLVVGVYVMHKLADPKDPTIFFYGDGSGAAVLRASESGKSPREGGAGFVSSAMFADGSFAPRWGIYAGGSAEPATEEAIKAGKTTVRLLERYPPEVNDEGWPRLVRDCATRGGFNVQDIDQAIFTQVRSGTIDTVMKNLELPAEKGHKIMHKWGYTGSACVAMALDDAIEQKKVSPGSLVVMVGSGVGYNQAAVAFRM